MFSTEYPYECTDLKYENDNVVVTAISPYSSSAKIMDFLMKPKGSKPAFGAVWSAWVQYDFKTAVTPKQIYIKGYTTGQYCTGTIQYLINGEWVSQATTTTTKNIDEIVTVPETKVSGIKVSLGGAKQVGTSAPFCYLTCIYIYYDTSSSFVQTSVKDTIMQNAFFQKVTSPVEII